MGAVWDPAQVCAVVLAGGRATRMGGVDKGLQPFRGDTLVANAVQRLRSQSGGAPGQIAINANRNHAQYAALGLPIWADLTPDYAGPLAGFLSAMRHCQGQFPLLLCVPCDSPLFPLDLLARLAAPLLAQQADIAMAMAPQMEADGSRMLRPQPVFCLLRCSLADSLQAFLESGERKIGAWTASQAQRKIAFDGPHDSPLAFANANTLDELHQLENP